MADRLTGAARMKVPAEALRTVDTREEVRLTVDTLDEVRQLHRIHRPRVVADLTVAALLTAAVAAEAIAVVVADRTVVEAGTLAEDIAEKLNHGAHRGS